MAAIKHSTHGGKVVAVMQPYFFPYGGFFSLMSLVDHFVFFDCVQFPRRGWVHRNQVPGPGGRLEWLTLPLARQPREVLIRDLAFASDAGTRLADQLSRYAWLAKGTEPASIVRDSIIPNTASVCDYLVKSVEWTASFLYLQTQFSRSSELALPVNLKGEARVIAAAKAVGATHYVNLPGGAELYEPERFRAAGLSLSFLRPHCGSNTSMLYRICAEDPAALASDVRSNAVLQHAG